MEVAVSSGHHEVLETITNSEGVMGITGNSDIGRSVALCDMGA
jgi:hypothetical protein